MSNGDEGVAGLGRHLLRPSRTEGLRRRLEAFLDEHATEDGPDLRDLRAAAAGGKPMSDVVDDAREERL
ncbi:hypothetical protein RH858_14035 [Halalkaliarchaeum sp. AArc-GB]|uniref:hypothetical protein n=1 Tax=Halalkaliarchaeum sp. AArc-GB TaxID=3074078 RepID=UPI00285C3F79|nr:hypothetical protein [Halalkaliarchaeum sp. AArc-GB]MDR5674244.1 hypothetical protein [Halalkaliarchaeum sp. AArc-GB]